MNKHIFQFAFACAVLSASVLIAASLMGCSTATGPSSNPSGAVLYVEAQWSNLPQDSVHDTLVVRNGTIDSEWTREYRDPFSLVSAVPSSEQSFPLGYTVIGFVTDANSSDVETYSWSPSLDTIAEGEYYDGFIEGSFFYYIKVQ